MCTINTLTKVTFLLICFLISETSIAQTNQCNNNAAGEVTVNGSCITSIFDTDTNNDYWDGTDFSCNSTDQDDKWVWFTATASSTTIIYNTGSDAVLHLFEGAACNVNMVPVDCADNTVTGDETIVYATTIGTVYHVRIQEYAGNATMLGTICVYSLVGGGADSPWPGNNLGSITCPGTTSVSDNTTGAIDDCDELFTAVGDHIYQFTLATAADITIDVCGAGWDTWLGLYSLSNASCDGSTIAVDDDGCGTASTIIMSCLAAGDYVVIVDGFTEGAYTLNLTTSNCACTPIVTASDCSDAVNICTNANFQIDPNGVGLVNEIPASGSLGNPLNANPGGSGNDGCLQSDENNSTWMIINISASGDLEYTFGGAGTQAGFYDWIMYPYSVTACADIMANTVAPVRCNWNGVDNGGTGLADPCCLPVGGDLTNFEPPLPVLAGEQYIVCFSNYSSVSTGVPLDFGGTATVSCTPLPVKLLKLNAEVQIDFGVKVSWSTLVEVNNSHFTIEKSENGYDFESVGSVSGMGNTSALHNYDFMDDFPSLGINYYRLKQVDFDGDFEYSSIVSVNVKADNYVEFYPNPSIESLSLRLNSKIDEKVTVLISGVLGKFQKNELQVKKGINDFKIEEFDVLESGCYMVSLFNEESMLLKSSKIIKQ